MTTEPQGETIALQEPSEYDLAAHTICEWLAARAKDFGITITHLDIATTDPQRMLQQVELLRKEEVKH